MIISGPSKVYHEWATPDFTNDDGDVDEQNYDKQWAAKWDLKGRIDFVHEAKITEGTAIVFDNVNLVHRVRMLRNKMKDGNKRYRSFLAFFIVDPEKEIKSTKNISTLRKQDYIDILMENTMIISRDIAILICDYCRCGYTLNEAKEIRKLNIEVRKKPDLKGKFACYRFGNSGDQIWFKDGKIHPYLDYDRYGDMDRDNFEWVSSTVSEF